MNLTLTLTNISKQNIQVSHFANRVRLFTAFSVTHIHIHKLFIITARRNTILIFNFAKMVSKIGLSIVLFLQNGVTLSGCESVEFPGIMGLYHLA